MTDTVMPVLTDLDEAVEWLIDYWSGENPDVLLTAMARVGRLNAPTLLFDVYCSMSMTTETLGRAATDAWSGANWPCETLERSTWIEWFEHVGYMIDGRRTQRPNTAMRLYRGAPKERQTGMSWTSDRGVAERFASGELYGTELGQVWTALVDPWRLYLQDNGRNESEYVIDTAGLVIERDQ